MGDLCRDKLQHKKLYKTLGIDLDTRVIDTYQGHAHLPHNQTKHEIRALIRLFSLSSRIEAPVSNKLLESGLSRFC